MCMPCMQLRKAWADLLQRTRPCCAAAFGRCNLQRSWYHTATRRSLAEDRPNSVKRAAVDKHGPTYPSTRPLSPPVISITRRPLLITKTRRLEPAHLFISIVFRAQSTGISLLNRIFGVECCSRALSVWQ